jgi:hypothetical protein
MRIWFCWLAALAALCSAGCFGRKNQAPPPATAHSASHPKLIVTADQFLTGKVASVNPDLQFVVLNFPIGQMPSIGQRLVVFRNGLKVGEVHVSGPQRDDDIIADIVAGEAVVGDEVSAR